MDYTEIAKSFLDEAEKFFNGLPQDSTLVLTWNKGRWSGSIDGIRGGYGYPNLESLFRALSMTKGK